jgi:hypothetical protein
VNILFIELNTAEIYIEYVIYCPRGQPYPPESLPSASQSSSLLCICVGYIHTYVCTYVSIFVSVPQKRNSELMCRGVAYVQLRNTSRLSTYIHVRTHHVEI